ncbi:hypothetical protein D3C77_671110 [compost metagenome]
MREALQTLILIIVTAECAAIAVWSEGYKTKRHRRSRVGLTVVSKRIDERINIIDRFQVNRRIGRCQAGVHPVQLKLV